MPDEFEEQDWVKAGVAAALARQYASDQRDPPRSIAWVASAMSCRYSFLCK